MIWCACGTAEARALSKQIQTEAPLVPHESAYLAITTVVHELLTRHSRSQPVNLHRTLASFPPRRWDSNWFFFFFFFLCPSFSSIFLLLVAVGGGVEPGLEVDHGHQIDEHDGAGEPEIELAVRIGHGLRLAAQHDVRAAGHVLARLLQNAIDVA